MKIAFALLAGAVIASMNLTVDPVEARAEGFHSESASRVLNYLYSISGSKTVTGQHNREPISDPAKWTNEIFRITRQYPGLWSSDFLYEPAEINGRWTMINEAKNQWRRGALVHLMYHACPPTQSEACGWEGGLLSGLSNDQWDELVSDGTPLNNVWKSRLNSIVPYLEDLKNNGVAVLWQPLHEMNQQKFWWGGRAGPNGTRKLFQITHDYLAKSRGLTNLIWIWDIQDFAGFPQDLSGGWKGYNPGHGYWDIAALDVYGTDRRGYTNDKYNAMVNVAEGRPIAIGECDRLPTAEELTAQPGWVFFMAWAELVKTKNSPQEIARLYDSRKTLTLSELPGWRRVSR